MTEIKISIANSFNQLSLCHHIRAVAFLPTEPYAEEFDDKDFEMATHVLVVSNEQPVACMRLRLITGNTIHWGRLAILPTLSGKERMKTLFSITAFVEKYSRKMKFTRIIGEVADKRLMKFWMKKGFTLTGEDPMIFGNKEYWPFEKYIDYAQLDVEKTDHIPKVTDAHVRTGRFMQYSG